MHHRFCYGARFVNAYHVHPCERFYAFHVVDQCFLFCQPHNADGKGNAREKIKSLGDHSDNGRGGAFDIFLYRHALHVTLIDEHEHGKGNYDDAYHLYQQRQRFHHARLLLFLYFLGIEREL